MRPYSVQKKPQQFLLTGEFPELDHNKQRSEMRACEVVMISNIRMCVFQYIFLYT